MSQRVKQNNYWLTLATCDSVTETTLQTMTAAVALSVRGLVLGVRRPANRDSISFKGRELCLRRNVRSCSETHAALFNASEAVLQWVKLSGRESDHVVSTWVSRLTIIVKVAQFLYVSECYLPSRRAAFKTAALLDPPYSLWGVRSWADRLKIAENFEHCC